MQTNQTPAGWFPDPTNPHALRWWDGQQWTEHQSPTYQPANGHPSVPAPPYPAAVAYGWPALPGAYPTQSAPSSDPALKWVLPVGRSGLAVAAGYLGLLSLVGVFAPVSIVVSILALRDLNRRPASLGRCRAVFGLVMGIVFTILMVLGIASNLSH